ARSAHIYALEAGFFQFTKNYQVFCQTIGGVFLTFLPKIKDDNSICQTAGDALRKENPHPLALRKENPHPLKKNPHKILEHKLEFTNSLIIKIHKEQAMEQREKCFED